MIEEAYVSFGTARLLKEKKFNEYTREHYFSNGVMSDVITEYNQWNDTKLISAPTQQMAMAWLREEKNIFITIYCGRNIHNDEPYYRATWQNLYDEPKEYPINADNNYSVYEICVEDAIKYCLTNLI